MMSPVFEDFALEKFSAAFEEKEDAQHEEDAATIVDDIEDDDHLEVLLEEVDPAFESEEISKPENDALRRLREGVVGAFFPAQTPFGEKPVVYADWTASGRGFAPLEEFVSNKVVPFYANTHTTSSLTGLQSTLFREEGRQIIQDAVNAKKDTDLVIFTGTGATGAVNKFATLLGLEFNSRSDGIEVSRPVVFVGPFEHHSNILPWRESNAEVVNVPERKDGRGVDQNALAQLLKLYQDRPLLIGSFSAGSNVTGILEDVNGVSAVLHRHGALACWDYAAAGPYAQIDMNPNLPKDDPNHGLAYKDAVFLSVHKFVGGISTPGVLIVKQKLLACAMPGAGSIGGGTVFFVREDGHRYLSNLVEREEGGTPDVVGAIRAGLTFQLKQTVGCDTIKKRDCELGALVAAKLSSHPKIMLLGPEWRYEARLPIVAFVIRHGSRLLHYNFVSAVMNDVFGIQTRGGCMCAGIYTRRLLGVSYSSLNAIETEMVDNRELAEFIKPGFTRLSLSYFATEDEVNYILDAVRAVADHAWKLLPLYRYNTRTGEWKHKTRFAENPTRLWLRDSNLLSGDNKDKFAGVNTEKSASNVYPKPDFSKLLEQSIAQIHAAAEEAKAEQLSDQTLIFQGPSAPLRWFVMPSEVHSEVCSDCPVATAPEMQGPVNPSKYWVNVNDLPRQYSSLDDVSVESKSTSSEDSYRGPKPPAGLRVDTSTNTNNKNKIISNSSKARTGTSPKRIIWNILQKHVIRSESRLASPKQKSP